MTDLSAATRAPRERWKRGKGFLGSFHRERVTAPDAHDGLLDIVFDADPNKPLEPVVVVRAELNGVSQETADRLYRMGSLLEARIPVRAYGEPSAKRNLAVLPITVTRDEDGGIRAAGDLHYLAAKGGKLTRHPTEADALPGARKLIEVEILSKPLAASGVKSIKTDDATGDRS